MKLYTEAEAPLLRAIGKLNYTNPFTPERLELEEIILGRPPAPERRVWNMHDGLRGHPRRRRRARPGSSNTGRLSCAGAPMRPVSNSTPAPGTSPNRWSSTTCSKNTARR